MAEDPPPDVSSALVGDPRLVLGWRTRSGLDGRRVSVHEDAFADLRAIAAEALTFLEAKDTRIRPYEPFAALEPDEEVFRLDLSHDSAGRLELDSAALVEMLRNSHGLRTLSAREMPEHHYAFYAIVWGDLGAEPLAFIRKANARKTIEAGTRFFRYEQTLRHVDRPDFVLEDRVDLVLRDQVLYVLSEFSARTLLGDTGLATATVPQHVASLKTVLGGAHSMTTEAAAAFEAVAGRKKSIARRLALLEGFFAGVTIDPHQLTLAARHRFSDPSVIIDHNGAVCADESHVEDALDLIEGRLYQDEVTGDERRADRTSRRHK